MVEADGGTCDLASYGRYNGGFYHTKALADGSAHVATLVFSNFEARRNVSLIALVFTACDFAMAFYTHCSLCV